MKDYTVLHAVGEPDWGKVAAAELHPCRWSPNPPPPALAGAVWTEEALLVRLESFAAPARAVNTEPDSAVWEDSCLEFFIEPYPGKGYYNFEINPAGALKVCFGPGRADRERIQTPLPYREYFRIKTTRTEEDWSAAYIIPLSLLFPDGSVPSQARANFYKCGDETATPHFQCWHPVQAEAPDFHRPECFGTLLFTAPLPPASGC